MSELRALYSQRELYSRRIYEIVDVGIKAVQDGTTQAYFKTRMGKIDSYYKQFESYHQDIIAKILASGKDVKTVLDEEDDLRKCTDEYYFKAKAIYYELFEKKPAPKQELNQSANASSVVGEKANIRLPKITLEKFDGDYRQWSTFFDMFKRLVHENTSISCIEKFQHLINSLSKEPLAIIKGFPLTESNYEVAFNTLVERYHNRRWLATTYFTALLNCPSAKSDSINEIRRLSNIFNENISSLKTLDLPTEHWDFIFFSLLLQKIDIESRRRFELKINSSENIPTFLELKSFLESQCRAFEIAEGDKKVRHATVSSHSKTALFSGVNPEINRTNKPKPKPVKCLFCSNSNHIIYNCSNFLELSPQDRHSAIKQKGLCFNCLSKHNLQNCNSKNSCRTCSKSHHTLLHFTKVSEQASDPPPAVTKGDASSSQSSESVLMAKTILTKSTSILLATVSLNVISPLGSVKRCRAVLDSCSQSSFISEKFARQLGLKFSPCSVSVHGIGSAAGSTDKIVAKGRTSFKIQPRSESICFDVSALVLPQICGLIPGVPVSGADWPHLENLLLADPDWAVPSKIDLLIGADLFAKILRPGVIEGNADEPTALNTVFGWVLLGKTTSVVENANSLGAYSCVVEEEDRTDQILRKFWETEEISTRKSIMSPDDMLCESFYQNTTVRTDSGRYVVSLPFRGEPNLGETRSTALRRFMHLESRLSKNKDLGDQYHAFMRDYLDSNHMSLAPDASESTKEYFVPHHAVIKVDSSTTKCRVVFDASFQSSNGLSLNDNLLTGPKLQLDILTILLRFRLHKIVFTADVKQMYRQINVSESDRVFQKIFWRFSSKDPVQVFLLNTVTFGVNCSPYHALRTVKQLCLDESQRFPRAAQIAQSDIYIDDVCSGSDSVADSIALREELIQLFKSGGFELRKWTSNCPEFLAGIPEKDREISMSFDESDTVKILGLHFNPTSDMFFYKVKPVNRECTKRTILSELAKIYDPTGFLSPLTLFAKCIMQHLWCLGLSWDASPPEYVIDKWNQYIQELPLLAKLQIPRRVIVNDIKTCQLHAFCDASEKGFSAVAYFRIVDSSSQVHVFLIAGKSKVAPLKKLSLPRLELCGAALLADLVDYILKIYKDMCTIHEIFAWSDSTIALSWIKSPPHRWKTFIANRVAKIQEVISPACWFHITSENNPADVASRGCLPADLINHPTWWSGPKWLQDIDFPILEFDDLAYSSLDLLSEERKVVLAITTEKSSSILDMIDRSSSLRFIIGVTFQCLKFCKKTTHKELTYVDSQRALFCLVKCVQSQVFHSEIEALNKNTRLSKPMRKLALFLDSSGVLRVGGRLINSNLFYQQKFPALLPNDHQLTRLIIIDFHVDNCHPGLNTLRYLLQRQFWILGAKRAIRKIVSKCINCFKLNPRPLAPVMGNLPAFRVNEYKPFSHVGVDFGGPYNVTLGKHRGVKSAKAYICVFVCMSVKAVHIELVSDLSSEAFLAALRRFMSRRGRVSHIYSDNGTNFKGAYRQILDMFKIAANQERLVWHFNPPTASAFGGIFEAAIKSVKTHLARVIGAQILTYEELYTVLVQVEALLNSRPISPMSSDPYDLQALTPGHFLTSDALTALPEPDFLDKKSPLSRWHLLQRLRQDFWSRWRDEYLHTLMQKTKDGTSNSLKVGSLVLVKNELLPPLKWPLARIVKLYPGADGVNRVADVRTSNGLFRRPLLKLCLVPVN